MTGTEKDEPYNDLLERVLIGTRLLHDIADVILAFDPRTGDFDIDFGSIIERTPEQITQGTPTKLTILSDRGYRYVVIRKQGGVYEPETWFTWIIVNKTPIH